MLRIKSFLKKNLLYIIIGGVMIAFYFIYMEKESDKDLLIKDSDVASVSLEEPENTQEPQEKETLNTGQKQEKMLYIDLKGEIQNPGVYEMMVNARVKDAIQKAGGFTKEADTLTINLAQLLVDEMVIYVPKKGETDVTLPDNSPKVAGNNEGLININKASASELEELSGIGPAKAEAIIIFRTENNGFKNIEEIKEVSGIGTSVYEQIKDKITVK